MSKVFMARPERLRDAVVPILWPAPWKSVSRTLRDCCLSPALQFAP
jgi:hypothetical protein